MTPIETIHNRGQPDIIRSLHHCLTLIYDLVTKIFVWGSVPHLVEQPQAGHVRCASSRLQPHAGTSALVEHPHAGRVRCDSSR